MTKRLLAPTAIRPELLAEYRAAAATMKAASDRFIEANAAYHALLEKPSLSVIGMGIEERKHAFEQFQADHAQRLERRIVARADADARYLDWQDAQRAFFAVCDHIQQEAVV